MVKVHSNKLGGIFIEKDLLRNSFLSIIKDYVNSQEKIDVSFDVKRNTLKFINVHFSRKITLTRQEEKNLYEQLVFILWNKFQINNKIITFSYEN